MKKATKFPKYPKRFIDMTDDELRAYFPTVQAHESMMVQVAPSHPETGRAVRNMNIIIAVMRKRKIA